MKVFLAAHAAASRWQEAADACLAALGHIPAEANVGFLYATDAFAGVLPEIFAYLKERTAVAHWTGTVGTGICGNGHEYHDEPAISLLIGSFPEDQFRILPPLTDKPDAFVRTERAWLARHEHHFGILHGDPREMQVPKLIGELGEAVRGGFMVGGLTSSRKRFPQIADGMVEGALSGILFDADVPVATALTQSCAPFGGKHIITQCQRNIAIRLDDRPALDVFREEVGEVLARNLDRAAPDHRRGPAGARQRHRRLPGAESHGRGREQQPARDRRNAERRPAAAVLPARPGERRGRSAPQCCAS